MSKAETLILVPTQAEIEKFLPAVRSFPHIAVEITGVGMVNAAVGSMKYIEKHRPDMVIMAGIAGAYRGRGIGTGDTVIVETEYTADSGSFADGIFIPKFRESFTCPYVEKFKNDFGIVNMRKAESNTVSAAAAPYIAPGADIENMEGAAFFAVYLEKGVQFLEIRAVSNMVGEEFAEWDIPLATANLAEALKIFLR